METTQKFILDNKLFSGAILQRLEDDVQIQLLGRFIKTKLGFMDFGYGDKNNWLAEYRVIKSPYTLHQVTHISPGGKYAGSFEDKESQNPYGKDAVAIFNLNVFSLEHLPKQWKWNIVEKSPLEYTQEQFLEQTNKTSFIL